MKRDEIKELAKRVSGEAYKKVAWRRTANVKFAESVLDVCAELAQSLAHIEELEKALKACRRLEEVQVILRKEGFVFENEPTDKPKPKHRWERLAFSLYTRIASIDLEVEQALDPSEEN